MKIELNRDWSEFLSALIARRVEFLLIGGHAVAGHAEPRLIEDLDVLVRPSFENARRLHDALVGHELSYGRTVDTKHEENSHNTAIELRSDSPS